MILLVVRRRGPLAVQIRQSGACKSLTPANSDLWEAKSLKEMNQLAWFVDLWQPVCIMERAASHF
jgi:hypothetical protein